MSDTYKDHLFAVIVAGGGGTRLWPLSRNDSPKQFLSLFGNTLTQITADRLSKLVSWENIIVVTTTNAYKDEVLRQLPKVKHENVLVEPVRKNTAPAHGLGALIALKKDKDAVIVNESADHLIKPIDSYIRILEAASQTAYSGNWMVAVGIKPYYPCVGYGHIKKGKRFESSTSEPIYYIKQFVEKPPLSLAKKYTASKNYYWNANQYVWRADTYLKALKKFEPKVGLVMENILNSIDEGNLQETIDTQYKKIPDTTKEGRPLSVDYAISEKAKNFLLIPTDYHWTDIGDWKEVWENKQKDHQGNVILGENEDGELINIDTSDALIYKSSRLISVVDVDNIIIVDTKDALLVCSKSRAQNVKQIVEFLKKKKKTKYL